MLSLTRRSVAALLVLATIAVGCGGDDDDTSASGSDSETTTTTEAVTTTEAETSGDVLEVAAAQGDLSTFLSALEAAGTMDDFHGEGPFTFFAPSDDAFAAYLAASGMSQAEVLATPEMLRPLLDYHVVNMAEDSEMVMGMAGQSFTTLSGKPLQVTVNGDIVMVGNATVERYDLQATNGVVHVIDAVLMPPA
jgi:uncharacterized surface protein with fasciclin (FAS1) repeats